MNRNFSWFPKAVHYCVRSGDLKFEKELFFISDNTDLLIWK